MDNKKKVLVGLGIVAAGTAAYMLYERSKSKNKSFANANGSNMFMNATGIKPIVATAMQSETNKITQLSESGVVLDSTLGNLYSVNTGGSLISSETQIKELGICYGTNMAISIANNKLISGKVSGEYAITVSKLLPNVTYYFKAYAIDVNNVVVYGKAVSFKKTLSTPVVVTKKIITTARTGDIFNIKLGYTATTGGLDSLLDRGIVFGYSPLPTIEINDGVQNVSKDIYLMRFDGSDNFRNAVQERATLSTPIFVDDIFNEGTPMPTPAPTPAPTPTPKTTPTPTPTSTPISTTPISTAPILGGDFEISFNVSKKINTSNIPSTVYIRAFAKNKLGITYGNQITFKIPK